MDMLPDFWRTEIWHPLTVHLPLASLLLGAVLYISGLLSKKKIFSDTGFILLLAGTLGAWIAVYTGNLADGVVARKICDPTVLKDHENGAKLLTWLFTGASLLLIVERSGFNSKIRKILSVISIILMLTGSGILLRTGHLGAQLVYQQAAGVYTPSEDCSEFTE